MSGVPVLLRAALRRDRWMLSWWTLGIVALYWATAVSLPATYGSTQALQTAARAIEGNAAFVAMSGPTRGLDTIGGQVAWQCQVFGGVLIGLMVLFLVTRHTRAEEEAGRDELLRSAPVGRLAPATAGVAVALAASVVVGLLVAVAVASTGLAAGDATAMGLGLAGCGLVFTGTSWVAAQVASTARGAYGLAGCVVAVAYGLRAVGDVSAEPLAWLTPIGWYSRLQAFSGVRWWPLLLALAATGLLLVLAARLVSARDHGSGLLPARPGPATGRIGSGWALAVRLHRGPTLGWCAGLLLGGLAYGAIGNDVDGLLGDSEQFTEVLAMAGVDLLDGFYATAIAMLALITGGYAVSSATRPRREEETAHTEALLATPLPRRGWLLGHVLATVAGTALVLLCGGVGLGVGYWAVTGDGGYAVELTWPVLQYLPALLVLTGFARVLYGLLPRRMVLAWLPLAYVAVVLFLGQLLRFPSWSRWLSPFEHVATVPAEAFAPWPLVVLAVVALALSVAGQTAFARRDIG